MFKWWSEIINQIVSGAEWSLTRLPIEMIYFGDSSSARTPLYQNIHNLNDGLKPPSTNLIYFRLWHLSQYIHCGECGGTFQTLDCCSAKCYVRKCTQMRAACHWLGDIKNSSILVDFLDISLLVPTPTVTFEYFGAWYIVNFVWLGIVLVFQGLLKILRELKRL